MIRVVIDTNLFLSGIFFDKNPEKLLLLGINGDINLIIPQMVVAEVKEKLAQQRFSDRLTKDVSDFLNVIIRACGEDPADILDNREFSIACRDADDAIILNHVCKIKPDYFVTGDDDLLAVNNAPIRICDLRTFFVEKFPELLN